VAISVLEVEIFLFRHLGQLFLDLRACFNQISVDVLKLLLTFARATATVAQQVEELPLLAWSQVGQNRGRLNVCCLIILKLLVGGVCEKVYVSHEILEGVVLAVDAL